MFESLEISWLFHYNKVESFKAWHQDLNTNSLLVLPPSLPPSLPSLYTSTGNRGWLVVLENWHFKALNLHWWEEAYSNLEVVTLMPGFTTMQAVQCCNQFLQHTPSYRQFSTVLWSIVAASHHLELIQSCRRYVLWSILYRCNIQPVTIHHQANTVLV